MSPLLLMNDKPFTSAAAQEVEALTASTIMRLNMDGH
jgi:hypothetical protein